MILKKCKHVLVFWFPTVPFYSSFSFLHFYSFIYFLTLCQASRKFAFTHNSKSTYEKSLKPPSRSPELEVTWKSNSDDSVRTSIRNVWREVFMGGGLK